MNIILLLGSFFGFTSVMIAAYADHALQIYLTGKPLTQLLTAIRYQQLYSIVILALGLLFPLQTNLAIKRWLIRSASLFIFGILFFSFGIYALVIFNMSHVVYFIPLGGMILMLGWLSLMGTALIKMK